MIESFNNVYGKFDIVYEPIDKEKRLHAVNIRMHLYNCISQEQDKKVTIERMDSMPQLNIKVLDIKC